jgi:DinB superfamily
MSDNLQQLSGAIAKAIDRMSPDDLLRHPEGKWCVAEILEHLNLTYIGTIRNLQRCVASGKTLATPDRSSKRWQRLLVTRLRFLPRGRKSPERVLPRGVSPGQVKAKVFENLARMEKVIDDCELRFGSNNPVADHPALGPLTPKEWRGFHLAHGRHHLKQILRLKTDSYSR